MRTWRLSDIIMASLQGIRTQRLEGLTNHYKASLEQHQCDSCDRHVTQRLHCKCPESVRVRLTSHKVNDNLILYLSNTVTSTTSHLLLLTLLVVGPE